jgi:hypothetical protein
MSRRAEQSGPDPFAPREQSSTPIRDDLGTLAGDPRAMKTFAAAAAAVSFVGGLGGLLAPGPLAGAFGVSLDPVRTDLLRLAFVSYLGYAALNWSARDVTDAAAWRGLRGRRAP